MNFLVARMMALDENQKVQLENEMSLDAEMEQSIAPRKAKPINLGIGAALVIGGIFGVLWLNRGQVSQNAIVWALSSKGVESNVEVEKIGPKGLKFKSFKIGKSNQETLIIQNGKIEWHYEFGSNGLVIDNIEAKALFGSFGLTKAGFDFRDLSPLLKPSGTSKPIIIKNIDIKNARILLESDFGPLRAHFDAKGNQTDGFRGLAHLFVPQQFLLNNSFYDKPIFLGFQTSGFVKDRPSFIGISALIKNQSFAGGNILPELEAQRIDGEINASIIMMGKADAKSDALYLNLYPSKLNFARFSPAEGSELLSGSLSIDKLYINPNQNLFSKGLIALNGGLDFAYGNFGNQSVEGVKSKFELARAEDGTSFSSILASSGAFRGPFAAANSNFGLKLNTKIPSLDKIQSMEIDGKVAIKGKIGSPNFAKNSSDLLSEFGLTDFANSLRLGIQTDFLKKKDRVLFALNGPTSISGAAKSNITFTPALSSNLEKRSKLEFVNKDNAWQFSAHAEGVVSGANNRMAKINANLDSLDYSQNAISAHARQIYVSNFPVADGLVSGNFNSANFSVNNGIKSGSIDGNLVLSQNGKIKLGQSALKINGDLNNNIGKLALSGQLRNFSGLGVDFNSSNLSLASSFQIVRSGAYEKIIGAINLNNKTDNLRLEQNANIKDAVVNGDIRFDMPTNFGNSKSGAQSFSLSSDGLAIFAASLRSKEFNAQDLKLNSPFAMSGKIGRDNPIDFSGDIQNISLNAQRFDSADISGTNFSLLGRAKLESSNGQTSVLGNSCFDYSIDSLRLAANRIARTHGNICPDNLGRIAQVSDGKLSLFAQVDADNFKLQMGDLQNGQALELGNIKAKFSPRVGGDMGINIDTNKFLYRFKSGPETWAIIESSGAKINAISSKNGNDFEIALDDLITKGLPVLATGGANAKFHSDSQSGLIGDFTFDNIKIKDAEPQKRFGDITLGGKGNLRNNQIIINAEAKNTFVGTSLAAFSLQHNINTGIGNIAFEAVELEFKPGYRNALQAKDIVPALQGIVEDAAGKVNGNANFSWAPNQPIQSNGVFSTEKFGFLSPLGPAEDISGTIAIADLLKLRTDERQNIKLGLFNPGVPIQDGTVGISFPGDNSIQLEEASWPFADGTLRLRPENWRFDAKDKDLTIDVDNIDVAKFLRLTQLKNLEIDGRMSGFLPIQIRDNEVSIVGGQLRAKDGGTLRYTGPSVNAPKPQKTSMAKLKERMFGKPPPQGVELAIDALRDLKYKVLEIEVNGRLTGDIKIFVLLEGYNKQVFDGHPFLFRVNISVPLMQAINGFKDIMDPNKRFNFLNPDGTLRDNVEIEGVPATPEPSPTTNAPKE